MGGTDRGNEKFTSLWPEKLPEGRPAESWKAGPRGQIAKPPEEGGGNKYRLAAQEASAHGLQIGSVLSEARRSRAQARRHRAIRLSFLGVLGLGCAGVIGYSFFQLTSPLNSGQIPTVQARPETTAPLVGQLPNANDFFTAEQEKASRLKHHQELAAKGDPLGLLRMGQRYATGDGVTQDLVKARELLTEAAAKQEPGAAQALAQLPAP
jgi:TPR repeat protein